MRYVELNPVRARMVALPADFHWSSYRTNAMGMPNALIVPHPIYRNLAPDVASCQAAYRQWCGEELAEDETRVIREATRFEWVLGSDAYQQFVQLRTGRRPSRLAPGRPRGAGQLAPIALRKVVSDPTYPYISPCRARPQIRTLAGDRSALNAGSV